MNQPELNQRYEAAVDAFETACVNRHNDPTAYVRARSALGDVVQAHAQWALRERLASSLEADAANLRALDAGVAFLLNRA